jgi:hypothetical protein
VKCQLLTEKIETLSKYFEQVAAFLSGEDTYWFRGHQDITWSLKPTALRFDLAQQRAAALELVTEFRRIAEIKIEKPPGPHEWLKWLQLAQHYGAPTRLLDWTESAVFALYFACSRDPNAASAPESDGVVFALNPQHLASPGGGIKRVSFQTELDEPAVSRYLKLGPHETSSGLRTVAIRPVWNSDRLMMQRGVFTLHGSHAFELDDDQAPSLIGIPIPRDSKKRLRRDLDRIGVDEMTLFPDLDYASRNLKRRAGLL